MREVQPGELTPGDTRDGPGVPGTTLPCWQGGNGDAPGWRIEDAKAVSSPWGPEGLERHLGMLLTLWDAGISTGSTLLPMLGFHSESAGAAMFGSRGEMCPCRVCVHSSSSQG